MDTRKWLDTRGGGGPFPNDQGLPVMKHEDVADRYHQHTKDCPCCSGVLAAAWNAPSCVCMHAEVSQLCK